MSLILGARHLAPQIQHKKCSTSNQVKNQPHFQLSYLSLDTRKSFHIRLNNSPSRFLPLTAAVISASFSKVIYVISKELYEPRTATLLSNIIIFSEICAREIYKPSANIDRKVGIAWRDLNLPHPREKIAQVSEVTI